MFSTLGICGGPSKTLRLLNELNRISRRNALLLANLNNPLMADKEDHLRYHELNREKNRHVGLVRIRFEYQGEVGEWFDLYLMTPNEIRELCEKSGCKMKNMLHVEEAWYVVVAEKQI